MTQTNTSYFNFATDTNGNHPWANKDNILQNSGDAICALDNGLVGNELRGEGSSAGGEVPLFTEITEIRVRVRCGSTNLGGASDPYDLLSIGFQGGNTRDIALTKNGRVTQTFNGDLAYWGIDQTQAREIADGNRYFTTRADVGSGDLFGQALIQYYDIRFTFVYPPNDTVKMPLVF